MGSAILILWFLHSCGLECSFGLTLLNLDEVIPVHGINKDNSYCFLLVAILFRLECVRGDIFK